MTEINEHLLKLIKEKKSINQISQELSLTNKQIYARLISLKRKGFGFSNKYYYDGNLVSILNKSLSLSNQSKKDEVDIITKKSDTEFNALAIADLHIGCELERLDLLNKIYDYCIVNKINIIIIAGDLIDGFFGPNAKKVANHEEQIKYFMKKYPFDKNILNFACLGNHDIDSLKKTGQDFQESINNSRPDIIPIGYGNGTINVKRDQIIVRHPLLVEKIPTTSDSKKLILRGHDHRMKVINKGANTSLYIPSLSDIHFTDNEILPGAVKINLTFHNGMFNTGHFEQLLIGNKVYTINELNYYLGHGKNTSQTTPVPLEEDYDFSEKPKAKVLTSTMSQVDKFNARYGK